MASSRSVTLLEAVGQYTGTIKAQEDHEELERELYRFVNWCGIDRPISQLSPPEIGEYSDRLAGTGTRPQAAEHLQIVRQFLTFARKKGLVEANLAMHVRVRRPRGRPGRQTGAPESASLTKEGHAELVAQLERLKEERTAVALEIQKAAADKDVRENAPLEAAREQSGHIESRIRSIEDTLKSAVIIDSSHPEPTETVRLGSRVSVDDLTAGRKASYTLVHRTEANALEGRISDISPLGKALVGRSVGHEVEVETPRGKTRFRILEVSS